MIWRISFFLAGLAAEKAALGEHASGGTSVLDKWTTTAKRFLEVGYGGSMFYTNPVCQKEVAYNSNLLFALREGQLERMTALCAQNLSVLEELAFLLLKKKNLNADDINPFLEKMNLPDWLPIIDIEEVEERRNLWTF